MKQYHDLLEDVLENGEQSDDRTGVGTRSVFGRQIRFDLREGFPLLTSKATHFPSIAHELLWFLRGDTNIKYLNDNGVTIWDEWADENGNLGNVYGAQWRSWQCLGTETHEGTYELETLDQIANVIDAIQNNPDSRRHIVTAWNPAEIDYMALPPCHCLFQFYVHEPTEEGGKRGLSCQLYQRSADIFLGVPFNIASYALLVHMIAQVCDLEPREFVHTFGDLHLYDNHVEQAKELLGRTEYPPLPELHMNDLVKRLEDFVFEDFEVLNYNPLPRIKAEVAV